MIKCRHKSGAAGLLTLALMMLAACTAPSPSPEAPLPRSERRAPDPKATEDSGTAVLTTPRAREDGDDHFVIVLLLPLTGPDQTVGQALLNAASMALFDAVDPRLTLLPLDTKSSATGTALAAEAAIAARADLILGPLRAENVRIVAGLAPEIPLISFSNDQTVAGVGRYIFGITPESEVRHIAAHGLAAGHRAFGALLPEGLYGDRVLVALGQAFERSDAVISQFERYSPSPEAVFEPIKRLTDYDRRRRALRREVDVLEALGDDVTDAIARDLDTREVLGDPPFTAALIAEGGPLLRTVAPLFPFYEADSAQIYGTGLMNDPELVSEPPLYGARFAAPDPMLSADFLTRYVDLYGESPPRLVTLAYDAVALAATWLRRDAADPFVLSQMTDPRGFMGLDGPFRLLPDGRIERALSIVEIQASGLTVVEAARPAFDPNPAVGR